jgi:hypothetical protein
MKKNLMLMVAAVSITTATFAQHHEKNEKKESGNVPAAVKQAFDKQYPGTKPRWDYEDGKYEAGFKHNGHEMSVLFNANGIVDEIEMEIPVSQLPAAATSYVTQHKMGKISEAAKITKANGEVNFEAEVKGRDVIFDATGKFLKEVKD